MQEYYSRKGYEYGIQLASFYQPGNFLAYVKLMGTGFTNANIMKDFVLQFGTICKPRPYDATTLNYNWQVWETKTFSVYANANDGNLVSEVRTPVSEKVYFAYNSTIINAKTVCFKIIK